MAAVIETEGLTKQWGSLVAVDDLAIEVAHGECYAFLGRNGAGKSTTARMLLDFIRPTRGRARVLGGSGSDPAIRQRVGYLPGDLNLPRTMTGWDAFRYFGSLATGFDEAEIDPLAQRFGLDPTRPFHQLSTGNRRKVGLILAFMLRPELLILDEPTSGLDPVLQQEFRNLLAERKADGATIWLTSHVMAEVEMVADRVGLIDDEGINPSSPLGFLWSNLYANVVPWVLMALGISLGSNAIAGDEEGGTLEYLLSKPVTRTEVVLARFAGMVAILFLVAVLSGVALAAVAPFVDLTTEMTTTAADGTTTTNPGVSVADIAAGTFAAFAVGLGAGAMAFLLGAATGRKGLATGVSAGIAVAGYLLYTLSNVTGDLEFLTWFSPWRWYVADAMFINGLTTSVLLPFVLAALCVAAGWTWFLRRDLQS